MLFVDQPLAIYRILDPITAIQKVKKKRTNLIKIVAHFLLFSVSSEVQFSGVSPLCPGQVGSSRIRVKVGEYFTVGFETSLKSNC